VAKNDDDADGGAARGMTTTELTKELTNPCIRRETTRLPGRPRR